MGGDEGLAVMLAGVARARRANDGMRFLLVGDEAQIREGLKNHPNLSAASEIVHAPETVAGAEKPSQAIRRAKTTSMGLAIQAVKSGEAGAAVSSGNTGALMAMSKLALRTMPGIDRPAICSTLPTLRGQTHVLDLGANVDCSPEHLLQFGIMGAMLVAAVEHNERPNVGLLNIGEEDIKGNETVKQAGELLRNSGLNFYGNVEGNDIYKGTVDVVVCDGFVGNVALKTSEGLAQMMATFLREQFSRNWLTKLAAIFAMSALKGFKHKLDSRRYNGAALLGLRGVVVKSHGSADAFAFEQAIWRAAEAARNRLIERISERMERERSAA